MNLSTSTREYWAKVRVSLHQPLVHEDDGEEDVIAGLIRLFGVLAAAEQVRSILEAEIEAGGVAHFGMSVCRLRAC